MQIQLRLNKTGTESTKYPVVSGSLRERASPAFSRFEVKNGLEDSVSQAFSSRPRMVEHAGGLRGVKVFTDESDASLFYLSTRSTTQSAFRQWRSNAVRHASHPGIPKGIKLDSAFSQLVVLKQLCD
jgi:heme-degrading monooxygenase HmoA